MSTKLSAAIPLTQLRIRTSCPSPATVRVAAIGEIDLATAHVLHEGLLSALRTHAPDLLDVDLAEVTFMDCVGLGVLVAVRRAAARTGCQLRVVNPQPIVRQVLSLTGVLGAGTAAGGPPRSDDEAVPTLADGPPAASEVGVVNGEIQPGDTVAIAGAGPDGRSATTGARRYGRSPVTAVDLADRRPEAADIPDPDAEPAVAFAMTNRR